MESSSGGDIEQQQKNCFYSWMSLQAKNMLELKHALIAQRSNGDGNNNQRLEELKRKVVRDFEEYIGKRRDLAQRCSSPYFAPSWNSPLENALLWMGGCRPSGFVRLIYALCGAETEFLLSDIINMSSSPQPPSNTSIDVDGSCSIGDLTGEQLRKINELHVATIHEEEKLTRRVASVQDDTSDMPAAVVAYYKEAVGEADVAVERALDKHEETLAEIMSDADNLRLTTMKKLLRILTSVQAADFLVAAAKLHLCMHEWGKIRDSRRHNNNNVCPYAGNG